MTTRRQLPIVGRPLAGQHDPIWVPTAVGHLLARQIRSPCFGCSRTSDLIRSRLTTAEPHGSALASDEAFVAGRDLITPWLSRDARYPSGQSIRARAAARPMR